MSTIHVRYWPIADIGARTAHVRFWSKSGHALLRRTCLLLTHADRGALPPGMVCSLVAAITSVRGFVLNQFVHIYLVCRRYVAPNLHP